MSNVTQHPAFGAVLQAMRMLAGVDDGAVMRDYQGFSGTDTDAGQALASLPAEMWTESHLALGREFATKYRRQLAGFGIDVSEIPAVDGKAASRREAKVDASRKVTMTADGLLSFAFAYDATLVGEVKKLPGRKPSKTYVNGQTVWAWNAPVTHESIRFINQHRFMQDAAVTMAMSAPVASDTTAAPAAPPALRVEVRTVADNRVPADEVRVVFYSPFNSALVEAFKALPGRMWFAAEKVNHAPVNGTIHAFAAKWNFAGLDLIDAALAERSEEVKLAEAERDLLREMSAADDAAPISFDGLSPAWSFYGFQNAGIRWAVKVKDGLIGDEMGVGKTAQAIGAVEAAGELPAVVVCPPVVRVNWKREWDRIRPGRKIFIAEGKTASAIPAGTEIVIVGDYTVADWKDSIIAWGPRSLIRDEAHRDKHKTSGRSQAVAEIGAAVDSYDRIGMNVSAEENEEF